MKFVDFPPVLQLQLKRFDFDYERGIMTKVRNARSLLFRATQNIIGWGLTAISRSSCVHETCMEEFVSDSKFLPHSHNPVLLVWHRITTVTSFLRSWISIETTSSTSLKTPIGACATNTFCTGKSYVWALSPAEQACWAVASCQALCERIC